MDDVNNEVLRQLVAAGAALLGEQGIGGVTVRAVADRAGVAVPTLQHYFPTKEQLLTAIFNAAFERDIRNTVAVEAALRNPPDNSEAAFQLIRAISAQAWGGGASATAARNAALLHLSRRAGPYAPARRWVVHRRRCFARILQGICPRPRMVARFLVELTLGLELLSLGCRRHPLMTLLNDELLRFGFDSVMGRAAPQCSSWFESAVLSALEADSGIETLAKPDRRKKVEGRQKILAAGARILAERGVVELTHRSVATEAGVAVSGVSYHFRAIDDLLYALYRYIQNEITQHAIAREAQNGSGSLGGVSAELRIGAAPAYVASLEVIIASAFDSSLADLAWKTRMTRGVYHLFQRNGAETVLDARAFTLQAYSIWTAGLVLLAEGTWSAKRLQRLLRSRMSEADQYFSSSAR